jgi:hypothetical protein
MHDCMIGHIIWKTQPTQHRVLHRQVKEKQLQLQTQDFGGMDTGRREYVPVALTTLSS